MTDIKAKAKWVRIGARKLDRVVRTIRGMRALSAVEMLKFMPQKGARILEKVVGSAIANAKNNHKLAADKLVIAEAYANKGIIMKRWQPKARGRIHPIHKKTSHITIVVRSSEEKSKEEA